jgi:hypothetical protein
MEASLYDHFEIVKFLIENNADVNIKDKVFLLFFYIIYIYYNF